MNESSKIKNNIMQKMGKIKDILGEIFDFKG